MKYFLAPAALVAALLSLSPAVTAQNQLNLGQLEAGQLVLNLNVTEQAQVDQDTLNASLQYVAQGRDRRALQDEVNRIMQAALERARQVSGVDVETSHYHVQIVQSGRPTRADIENPVFRAQQGLQLKSEDSAALLELLGALQAEGLTLNSLYYSLSAAAHERVAGELLHAALTKLQSRASDAASVLGKGSAALVEVSMDGSPNFMEARMRMPMMAMAADAGVDFAPPSAEPGQSMVSVSVSARAVLSP